MKCRGQECERRDFSDETGSGFEWFIPGDEGAGRAEFVAGREHATRIVSKDERDALVAAEQLRTTHATAADEREAVYQLQRATLEPGALAAKVDELQAARVADSSPTLEKP